MKFISNRKMNRTPNNKELYLKKLSPTKLKSILETVKFPKIRAGKPIYRAKSPIGLSQLWLATLNLVSNQPNVIIINSGSICKNIVNKAILN